jgi:hypothetical protein
MKSRLYDIEFKNVHDYQSIKRGTLTVAEFCNGIFRSFGLPFKKYGMFGFRDDEWALSQFADVKIIELIFPGFGQEVYKEITPKEAKLVAKKYCLDGHTRIYLPLDKCYMPGELQI